MAAINPWKFFVYELTDQSGQLQYIGKGSSTRLKTQMRKSGLNGQEVARFKKEDDAYAFEVQRIAEFKPALNKCKGGNGNKATVKIERKDKFSLLCEKIGTRAVAARLWLAFANKTNADMSKVDSIRAVAYG